MSEPEDERLRAARIKAALAFFGPQRATLRAALEGAGFTVKRALHERFGQMAVFQVWPYESRERVRLGFSMGMTASRCRLWLLGLPEEWEVADGDYEAALAKLLLAGEA